MKYGRFQMHALRFAIAMKKKTETNGAIRSQAPRVPVSSSDAGDRVAGK